ncbi:MAG: Fic family protein [Candidatus Saccharibacteria bacterium]
MTDYFTDDDSVLENKLGISDPKALQDAEQDIVTKKTARLLTEKPPTQFDFNYLKYLHKILFEDIYDFAGKIRTVDIAKADSSVPFAHAPFIIVEGERIFEDLRGKQYLADLGKQTFIKEITRLAAELNALHPFREGNGRTIRLFLILLADHAGYLLDYSQVSAGELIDADKRAFEGGMDPLLNVYQKVVIST